MDKVLSFDELKKKVAQLKRQGKTVVQSHGVYDLIHPGIVQHLRLAKEQGDVLVVTIIRDKDVRLGPGRPLFSEKLRIENVVALQPVDYVALVEEKAPFECVRLLQPDVFAKGKAFKERDQVVHGGLFDEGKTRNFGPIRIFETDGFTFQTQDLANDFLGVFPDATRRYLKELSQRYSFRQIADQLDSLKDLKVLLIGDGIIDEYHYCDALGRASKAHLVVNKYFGHEVFAGGAFAIANHLSSICGRVHLVSLLGDLDRREKFIRKNLRSNVTSKFFYRGDGPTIVKKRYVNRHSGQKLFEVNYLNDNYIDGGLERSVLAYLGAEIKKYDIVLVSDFGHGFVTERVIEQVRKKAGRYAVNTQTNAANSGYNLITKYRAPYFICLDEGEVRLAAQAKHTDIEQVARKIKDQVRAKNLIVTLGRNGSIGIGRQGRVSRAPIFSTKVVDTIGAGDAFFAFTAPSLALGLPLDLVSFIGNVVGALAVQIVGNKKPVEKYEVVEFIYNLLRRRG